MTETRLTWEMNFQDEKIFECYNDEDELLGELRYENVGRHMHWCWYQERHIRMSPSCLEEVRTKQKELWKTSRGGK